MFSTIAVVGAGAVGASIVSLMLDSGLPVTVVADRTRARRISARGLTVNGKHLHPAVDADASGGPYSLVIVATKSTGLADALALVRRAAGRDGIVMSLLNGISSEGIIRSALGSGGEQQAGERTSPGERVVPAMILGIDAVRTESGVTYLNTGTVHFGSDSQGFPVADAVLAEIEQTFRAAGVPAVRSANITKTLWWKFMINVGINQASAVMRGPYGLFQRSKEARGLMRSAMQEVITLSARAGTGLSEEDLERWLETLAGLDPGGKTSMLQDVEARRLTEVELFSGTVLSLAAQYDLPVPVNLTLYRIIRGLEAGWQSG